MKANTTGYVLLSQGEYSDYQNAAFRVLKPFSFADTAVAFKAQWTPTNKWQTKPSPEQYIAWLSAQGFIEDAPEIQEVHVGGYDFDDSREYLGEVAEVVFYPRAQNPTQPAPARSVGGAERVEMSNKGTFEAVFGHLGMTSDEVGNRMVALQDALAALLEHEGERETNGIGLEYDSAALEKAKNDARALLA